MWNPKPNALMGTTVLWFGAAAILTAVVQQLRGKKTEKRRLMSVSCFPFKAFGSFIPGSQSDEAVAGRTFGDLWGGPQLRFWRYSICLMQNDCKFGISGCGTVANNFHRTEPFHQLFGQELFFLSPCFKRARSLVLHTGPYTGTKNKAKLNWKCNCK